MAPNRLLFPAAKPGLTSLSVFLYNQPQAVWYCPQNAPVFLYMIEAKRALLVGTLLAGSGIQTACSSFLVKGTEASSPTASATPDASGTQMAQTIEGLRAQLDAQSLTLGALSSSETPVPAATPIVTSTPDWRLTAWSGQAEFNQIGATGNGEREVAEKYLDLLISQAWQAGDNPQKLSRDDSAITALMNVFKGPEFDAVADPKDETGMQMTGALIQWVKDRGNVADILNGGTMIMDLSLPVPGTDLRVMGVWGPANDRDAITAVLSSGLHYLWSSNFRSDLAQPDGTLVSVNVQDPAWVETLGQWQSLIDARTLDHTLQTSEAEEDRRNSDANDASDRIHPALQGSDQIVVCEEIRAASQDGNRESQPQTLISVTHIAGGEGSLTKANSEAEYFIDFVIFNTKTGKWDVVSLTTRRIVGEVDNSVTGNELEPCGVPFTPATQTPKAAPTGTNPPADNTSRPPDEPTRVPPTPGPTVVPTNDDIISTATPGN